MAEMNPKVRAFFNLTAGLEKFIVAVLAAASAYVAALSTLDEPMKALIVAIIGAAQMLYTTNTTPTPPSAPLSRADVDRIDA